MCLQVNMFISLSGSLTSTLFPFHVFHFYVSFLLSIHHGAASPGIHVLSHHQPLELRSTYVRVGFYLLFFLLPWPLLVNSPLSYWALSWPVAMACVYRFVSVVRFVHTSPGLCICVNLFQILYGMLLRWVNLLRIVPQFKKNHIYHEVESVVKYVRIKVKIFKTSSVSRCFIQLSCSDHGWLVS